MQGFVRASGKSTLLILRDLTAQERPTATESLARKSSFREHFQRRTTTPFQAPKFSAFVFTELVHNSAHPASPRGAYARSSRYVGWGCGGRVGSQRGFGHADERCRRGREIVWAWPPGAEAKRVVPFAGRASDGDKNADPRGEHV